MLYLQTYKPIAPGIQLSFTFGQAHDGVISENTVVFSWGFLSQEGARHIWKKLH